jgi:hypothetical protein
MCADDSPSGGEICGGGNPTRLNHIHDGIPERSFHEYAKTMEYKKLPAIYDGAFSFPLCAVLQQRR